MKAGVLVIAFLLSGCLVERRVHPAPVEFYSPSPRLAQRPPASLPTKPSIPEAPAVSSSSVPVSALPPASSTQKVHRKALAPLMLSPAPRQDSTDKPTSTLSHDVLSPVLQPIAQVNMPAPPVSSVQQESLAPVTKLSSATTAQDTPQHNEEAIEVNDPSVLTAKTPPSPVPEPAQKVKEPLVSKSTFLWPVLGNVVMPFGKTPDGLHNDGLNIKVRKGTPIRAAESGVVTYTGNTVKGFGNLVLIKHSQGWTTAYAHAQKITVKKHDKVKRGQIIAYSGDTGNTSFPQLHFELRRNVEPVDPIPHLVPQ